MLLERLQDSVWYSDSVVHQLPIILVSTDVYWSILKKGMFTETYMTKLKQNGNIRNESTL